MRGLEAVNAGRNDRAALDKADALIAGLPDFDPKQRRTDRPCGKPPLILDQKAEMQAQRAARMEETRLRRAEATFNASRRWLTRAWRWILPMWTRPSSAPQAPIRRSRARCGPADRGRWRTGCPARAGAAGHAGCH